MIRVAHETAINAPAESAWSVATDIELWPDWLPTVTAVRRLSGHSFGIDSRFELKQPLQSAAIWQVTDHTRHMGFTWRRLSRGLLSRQARHEVVPSGATVISRLGLSCAGPVHVLFWPILWAVFTLTLRAENAALKRRCETRRGIEGAKSALSQPDPEIVQNHKD